MISKIRSEFNYGRIVPVIDFNLVDAGMSGEIGEAQTGRVFNGELGQNQTGKQAVRIADGLQQMPLTTCIADFEINVSQFWIAVLTDDDFLKPHSLRPCQLGPGFGGTCSVFRIPLRMRDIAIDKVTRFAILGRTRRSSASAGCQVAARRLLCARAG